MPGIYIQANDTLFFRDGKPFTMLEETWANSLFPNIPNSFFYGALASLFAAENNLTDAETIKNAVENLRIRFVSLVLNDVLSFPIPLDLVGINGETFGLSVRTKKTVTYSKYPFSKILKCTESGDIDELDKYYLNKDDFFNYLSGQTTFVYDTYKNDIDRYSVIEPKIGIARSQITNTTREGALYRVGMNRLEGKNGDKMKFHIEYDGITLKKESGFLRLGGEGKTAFYSQSEGLVFNETPYVNNENRFKLYMTSPAIFKQGILPDFIDPYTLEGEIKDGMRVKLVVASVGKFLNLGGFDMAEQKPKAMNKAVPAGSVYFFESIDNTEFSAEQMNSLVQHFNVNKQSICTFSDFAQKGLGACFISKYNNLLWEH